MQIIQGNAIVGQSGGPTAAINATLAGVIREMLAGPAQAAAGSRGESILFGMRNGVDGLLRGELVNLTALFTGPDGSPDEEQLRLLEHTPAAALGSCRRKLPSADDPAGEETYHALFSLLDAHHIHTFFYIGGNDSMDTVAKLSAQSERFGYPLQVIGIPKTIDNDLEGTDHTPGFGSAAKFVATVMQEILLDCAVYTVPAVTVVEVMGRDAGWLTASSAIGRIVHGLAPDLVYLPETDFSMEEFLEDVSAALRTHPNVVVAVSEGIHFSDGTRVCESENTAGRDAFGHAALSGTGKVLERAVRARLGCKVRSVELNITQRCAAHILSGNDIAESVRVGRAAVRAAGEGLTGQMMTLTRVSDHPYTVSVSHRPVASIANRVRYVERAFINERGNNVTDDCLRYLLPLIGGEDAPVYQDGLPCVFRLDGPEPFSPHADR